MVKSKKNQKFMYGGFSEYPGSFQTKNELLQFGSLPGNDWAAGLGHNPAITDQMGAGAGLYRLKKSGKKSRRKYRK